MAVLVFDYVTDVLHAVRAAPVAELVAEALLIEGARDVHIDVAYMRAGRLAVPQVRELVQVALAQRRAQRRSSSADQGRGAVALPMSVSEMPSGPVVPFSLANPGSSEKKPRIVLPNSSPRCSKCGS